jgi:hypothetical protein
MLKEQPAVALSEEGKKVFKKFCLIGTGIPAVLLAFISILFFSPWALDEAQVSSVVLNLSTIGLAAAGLIIWAFFSFVVYKRLWRMFPDISEKEKGWSYAEGTFGYVGVGVSTSSVLGVFYYLFSGDYYRSVFLIALSIVLFTVESAMFPNRIAEVENAVAGMK